MNNEGNNIQNYVANLTNGVPIQRNGVTGESSGVVSLENVMAPDTSNTAAEGISLPSEESSMENPENIVIIQNSSNRMESLPLSPRLPLIFEEIETDNREEPRNSDEARSSVDSGFQEQQYEQLFQNENVFEQSTLPEENDSEMVEQEIRHENVPEKRTLPDEEVLEQELHESVLEESTEPDIQQEPREISERTFSDNEEPNNATFQELLKVFECSGCHNCIRPPIYQCRMGHLRCRLCSYQSPTRCILCAIKSQKVRNIALDKIATQLRFPCKNVTAGCTVLRKLHNIEEHEQKECLYRKIECPYSGMGLCSHWKGTKLQVIPHILSQHLQNLRREHGYTGVLYGQEVSLLPYVEAINYGSSIPTRTMMWTFIQKFMKNFFLINLFYEHNEVENVHFITVRMIETVSTARQYLSKVALIGPNGEQLCFEGACHSIYDNTNYIYRNRDCLTFDNTTAIRCTKTLPNDHKALKFTCNLKKVPRLNKY